MKLIIEVFCPSFWKHQICSTKLAILRKFSKLPMCTHNIYLIFLFTLKFLILYRLSFTFLCKTISAVSSAFQHEAVLSNACHNRDNENTMQRFARESAQESMDFIHRSGKHCWRPA